VAGIPFIPHLLGSSPSATQTNWYSKVSFLIFSTKIRFDFAALNNPGIF
jgi:hypothetical protein